MNEYIAKSKVTKKGTITIPKKLRDKYGICTGDMVGYAELGDGIKIVPLERNEVPITIKEMWDEADERGITLEKIVETVRKVRPEVYREEYGDN